MDVLKLTGKSGFGGFRWKGLLAFQTVIGPLIALTLPFSAFGDPEVVGPVATASTASKYLVINRIGEPDEQVAFTDDKLAVHRRSMDPFGISSRGKFKGLPAIAEHPVTASGQPNQIVKAVQSLVPDNGPTLDQAVQQLAVGGVNIAEREILIGSQRLHEGDLLVLALSGRQFVVWVQSIDRRGVQFCDINLQQRALRSFRFGPSELPAQNPGHQTDVREFLNQDAN
jgi:hypothetical protein